MTTSPTLPFFNKLSHERKMEALNAIAKQALESSVGLCGEVAKPCFDCPELAFDEDCSFPAEEMDVLQAEFQTLEWSSVLMPDVKHVTAINMRHKKFRHDKSDFAEKEIDLRSSVQETIDCPQGMTLKNLTMAILKVKRCGLDFWHELYCGAVIDFKTIRTLYRLPFQGLFVQVDFDYGS